MMLELQHKNPALAASIKTALDTAPSPDSRIGLLSVHASLEEKRDIAHTLPLPLSLNVSNYYFPQCSRFVHSKHIIANTPS